MAALFILALDCIIKSVLVSSSIWTQMSFVSLSDSTFQSVWVLPLALPIGRQSQNFSNTDL